jgi:hypothetical protein
MFSTKSRRTLLEKDVSWQNNKWVGNKKYFTKIKTFLWQVLQNAILTRDNMKDRKWPGSHVYSMCEKNESTNHILLFCSCAKIIWGVLGKIFGTI